MKTGFNKLSAALAEISDVSEIEKFLTELTTESERKDLELRWCLMEMLYAGKTQRDISSTLGVSLCKITRGAKILKQPDSVAKRIISKIEE